MKHSKHSTKRILLGCIIKCHNGKITFNLNLLKEIQIKKIIIQTTATNRRRHPIVVVTIIIVIIIIGNNEDDNDALPFIYTTCFWRMSELSLYVCMWTRDPHFFWGPATGDILCCTCLLGTLLEKQTDSEHTKKTNMEKPTTPLTCPPSRLVHRS